MDEKIDTIIPTLSIEIGVNLEAYGVNESAALLAYYLRLPAREKAVVDTVLRYICGWKFEELLFACGLRIGKQGELLKVQKEQ